MIELVQAIPDHEVLLSLEPEELAGKLILLLRKQQRPMFHPNSLINDPSTEGRLIPLTGLWVTAFLSHRYSNNEDSCTGNCK